MTRLTITKAREALPEIISRAAYGSETTVVSRRGKDLAAIIPMEDLHLLERLAKEEMDRIDVADALASLEDVKKHGTIPLRDLMLELRD